MAWRVANSLLTLHAQLKSLAPRAAPPATKVTAWGTIGDALHDPTSDHSPHDFSGWGTAIVTAADFPHCPTLGLDAGKVLDAIRTSRDPRAKYGIFNRRIFSNHPVTQSGKMYGAWEWRPYSGSDAHDTHGHLSVVGSPISDSESPWQLTATTKATAAAEGERMQFVAKDEPSGQYYVCDGLTSRPVPAGSVSDVLYLARTLGWSHGAVGVEWSEGGYCRLGWNESAFGRVVTADTQTPVLAPDSALVDALASALADKICKAPRHFQATD